ncbi:DUF4283 domain-containing protein [Cephalotus follicularis]|uniref:DUF4283 domain-containing protein n=1 Tax=Cephalotus follicularis TaxID=3775 RepID=A0A1Q3AYB3_CEPFO|nr:DUF4283 domain-containing protein [Cephalotus follicularis]
MNTRSLLPFISQAAPAFTALTLLAKFASCVPSVNSFDHHINSTWGLSKPATVGLLDHRHITIQLQSLDDLSLAWSRESRAFNNKSFLLLRWSPDSRRRDSPLATISGLPPPLHNPSILKSIGDSLGRYLRLDANTVQFKHPRAARICVELDLSAPPPPAFIVAIGDLKLHQRIIFESRLLFCLYCRLQGHSAPNCRSLKRKLASVLAPPAAPSGKDNCGGLLPAGSVSSRLPNLAHPLPPDVLPRRPQGVCENAQCTLPSQISLFFGLRQSQTFLYKGNIVIYNFC